MMLSASYSDALKDPFQHGPKRMGFGTMVPTVLGTAYVRGNFTVNADGSFGICLCPDIVNMIILNAAASSSSAGFTVTVPAANASALTSQMIEARITSGGVRAFALFPDTAAPGVLVAGTYTGSSRTSVVGTSTDAFFNSPSAVLGIGTKGAFATLRPIDPESYSFYSATLSGVSATVIPSWGYAQISGKAFPVGTQIWYEAVLNLEGIPTNAATSSGINQSDVMDPSLPSSIYSNIETFARTVVELAGPPVIMEGDAFVANPRSLHGRLYSALGQGLNYLGSMHNHARWHAEQGRLVAGGAAREQFMEGGILIEEMKEE